MHFRLRLQTMRYLETCFLWTTIAWEIMKTDQFDGWLLRAWLTMNFPVLVMW